MYIESNELVIRCYCQWYVLINRNQNFHKYVINKRQVSFAGHRSRVIVLLKQKVSQTLVKAKLRPN